MSGVLVVKNGRRGIGVNRSHHPNRDQVEVEANQFAAEILMPETLLRKLITEGKIDLGNDIETAKLAQFLRVSEQALTIRLMHLKLAGDWSTKS